MLERLRNEATAPTIAIITSLMISAVWVAARAARDALFLSSFPIETLPRMMLASAGLSLVSALVFARLLTRHGPARVLPVAFGISTLLFVAEWSLASFLPGVTPVALYLHIGALAGMLASGFYSVLNERFDPYTAKTVLGRAGAFGALGGVAGGLLAERVGALGIGVVPMLLVLAFVHLLCAAGVVILGGPPATSAHPTDSGASEVSGFAMLRGTSLLRNMAVLTILVAGIEELLDYALKSAVTERFPGEAGLIRFFAIFEMTIGTLAFAFQFWLGGPILQRFGLGWAMALRPALVMVSAAGGAALGRFGAVLVARATDVITMRSSYRVGFELLYTSLPNDAKRSSKPIVDVMGTRAGEMAGATLILVLLAFLPSLPRQALLAIGAIGSVLALVLVARIQRRYVEQLAESLEVGAISLDPSEAYDAVTNNTLFGTASGVDRDDLMQQLEAARAAQAEQSTVAEAAAPSRSDADQRNTERKEFFEKVEALDSDDPATVRSALYASRDDLRLVPHVIPLLRDGPSADPALVFLRSAAPKIVGQLTDALVDPESEARVRRRVASVLELSHSQRGFDGVCAGLEDPDFSVRLACARAAARLVGHEPELAMRSARAFAIAGRELSRDSGRANRSRGQDDAPVLLDRMEAAPVDLLVEYVFTVLALALTPNLMAATLRSLFGDDARLRGTALEYLQSTLPEDLRVELWPLLPDARGVRPTSRSGEESAEELMKATAGTPGEGKS